MESLKEYYMKKLHLICNAHIDPVWQWSWDEGLSAAISTFKSAADLADEFDYIFCHNESLLYEEIEDKAPALFERIVKLVKQGKWVITGGWYLQPDCMLPSGESIIRQIEVGNDYFYKKFGVKPTVATNYDSFGYSIGLVQILKKCGYEGMLVCRPNAQRQFKFPSRFFDWIAPDGSKIIVSNSESYSSFLGKAVDKVKRYVLGITDGMLGSASDGKTKKEIEDVDYVLWGVGNHGGGPSRKDLQDIKELKIDDIEICHSTPERLFADKVRVGGEVRTSLVPCMPGCYSTMAKLKRAHRETENLFYSTEKILSVAKLAGYKPDLANWLYAEKKLLLAEFHDILPGTTVADGEQEGLELLLSAKKVAKDYRSKAFLYLVMGEKPAEVGEYPIFVFNYMPYEVRTQIEAEFSLADQNWSEEFCYSPRVFTENGEEIECQQIKEASTLNLDWRKRIVFTATLKPLGITRFSVRTERTPILKKKQENRSIEELLVGKDLTSPVSFESFDDTADPWGMSDEELIELGKNPVPFEMMLSKETASFCGFKGEIEPVHTIEDGKILTSVEAAYKSGKTNALARYIIYKNESFVDIHVTVEYNDKNKLIRLKIPAPVGKVIGDGPYVVEEKMTKREIAFQKWVGVKNDNGNVFSVINDGVYGGKFENGYIYITLLRGAGYCFHPIPDRELYPKDRYLPRIENGRYEYKFRIYCGNVKSVCEEAELFNQQPYALNVFPIGGGAKRSEIKTDSPVVMPMIRIKDNGYEMRSFNPSESEEKFTLHIDGKEKSVSIKPYAIATIGYNDGVISESDDLL